MQDNRHLLVTKLLGLLVLTLTLFPFLVAQAQGSSGYRPQAPVALEPGQSATLLPDGRWLLVGGEDSRWADARVVDERGEATPLAASLRHPRAWHSATVLPDGTVLVLGGVGPDGRTVSVPELFYPARQAFESVDGSGLQARSHHTATLLTDGRVLVVGGLSAAGEPLSAAELWNPRTGSTEDFFDASLQTARFDHLAELLSEEPVRISTGKDADGNDITTAELYQPQERRFYQLDAPPSEPTEAVGSLSTPRVVASVPEAGARHVRLDALLAIRFSRHLNVLTLNGETVLLSAASGKLLTPVAAEVVPAESGLLAFVTPQSPLLPSTQYVLALQEVQDNRGLTLPPTFLSFTTEAKPQQVASEEAEPESALLQTSPEALGPLVEDPAVQQQPVGLLAVASEPLSADSSSPGVPTDLLDTMTPYNWGEAENCGPLPPPVGGPPPGGCAQAGDPVDCATGLFVYEHTDLRLDDTLPIELKRTYRSDDLRFRHFGIGTTFTLGLQWWRSDTGDSADLILSDGGRVHYRQVAEGGYEHTATPTAFHGSRAVDWGSSRITLRDGTVYRFHPGQGAYLRSITDRNGNTVTIDYWGASSSDRFWSPTRAKITSPNGKWINLEYGESGQVIKATDSLGRSVGYSYDVLGRLAQVTDAEGGVTEYAYDVTGMISIKNPRGITEVVNVYDVQSRVIEQTHADGGLYLFAYSEREPGKIVQADVTDPRGNTRRMVFNDSGYITSDTSALGKPEEQTTTYMRDPASNLVLSKTDALDRTTRYRYDDLGNVIAVTRLADTGEAVTDSFTYEPTYHRIETHTDPLGHTTAFAYDERGNLVQATDPLGGSLTLTYDPAGLPLTITDPGGNMTRLTHELGDLTEIADPLGHVTKRFTDHAGRTIASTDPLGRVTRYDYDGLDRLVSVTDPLGGVIGYRYDPNGNLLSVTDPRGNVTRYSYDRRDRVSVRTDPLGNEERFDYDGNDNLIAHTDRNGEITTRLYDGLDRHVATVYGIALLNGITLDPAVLLQMLPSTVVQEYDAGNRLVTIIDPIGGTLRRTYDGLDRLVSESTAEGVVSYAHDSVGRRTGMTADAQASVQYEYDAADRLLAIVQGAERVGFAYDAAGRRSRLTLPNGIVADYGYDEASRLTAITYRRGEETLGDLHYAYDATGQRTEVSGSMALAQLPEPLGQARYNAANQLVQWEDEAFSYDANGQLTSDGQHTYLWNARGELAAQLGPTPAVFTYDALGRRSGKVVGGTLTQYLHDGHNPLLEKRAGEPDTRLLNGLGPDERFVRSGAEGTRSFLTDALGSTVALTDEAGAVRTQYRYAPYGAASTHGEPDSNPFQYTGRENDQTGLYYYRARYYSPTARRFVSEDPIGFAGGGVNVYAYVLNNPLKYVDPDGLSAIVIPRPIPIPITAPRPIPYPIDPILPVPYDFRPDLTDDEKEYCRKERRACARLCEESMDDPDRCKVYGGSIEKCIRGCLPYICGGNMI